MIVVSNITTVCVTIKNTMNKMRFIGMLLVVSCYPVAYFYFREWTTPIFKGENGDIDVLLQIASISTVIVLIQGLLIEIIYNIKAPKPTKEVKKVEGKGLVGPLYSAKHLRKAFVDGMKLGISNYARVNARIQNAKDTDLVYEEYASDFTRKIANDPGYAPKLADGDKA